MQPPDSKPIGIVLLILGLLGVACLTLNSPFRFLGLAFGFLLFVVALGILGKSGQFARALKPFVKKPVRLEIWGEPLPGTEGGILQIDSVAPLGLGIWIYLRPLSGGKKLKLKIAQPTTLAIGSSGAEITFAGYVQWDSRRIKDLNNRRAPGTVVLSLA